MMISGTKLKIILEAWRSLEFDSPYLSPYNYDDNISVLPEEMGSLREKWIVYEKLA